MIKTNYHTHNEFCDGKGPVEAYIQTAVEKGFTAIGFSSHAPLPMKNEWTLSDESLPDYLGEVDRLKLKWKDRIQVYKGLEIDYIPGSQAPGDTRWKNLKLDYAIGSVHTTTGLDRNPEYHCVDGPEDQLKWLIDELHEGSWEKLSEAYYTRVSELVGLGEFAFLGHFDLIKKRNRNNANFSEQAPWYRRQVLSALDSLAGSGIILEVNSGAISRGVLDEVYPSPWIIAEAFKREIPTMINADAHRPEDIDCNFDESKALLRETGYRETWALIDGDWTAVPI
jgi:histidinol-phosphatase (PHP family)